MKEKFREKILGGNFAKFVFTGWTLCFFFFCKLKLREKKWKFSKCFSGRFEIEGCWKILKLKMFGSCVSPLVGRHVVKHG